MPRLPRVALRDPVFLSLLSACLSTLAGSSLWQLQTSWLCTPKSRGTEGLTLPRFRSPLSCRTDLGHISLLSQSLARWMDLHEELRPIRKSYGHRNTVGIGPQGRGVTWCVARPRTVYALALHCQEESEPRSRKGGCRRC